MNFDHRAKWQDDECVSICNICKVEFDQLNRKHHCRLCGLVVCATCSPHNLIIPKEELVRRPRPFWDVLSSDDDDFREPQRTCSSCEPKLRSEQTQLKALVSRCNQETVVDSDSTSILMPQLSFYLENEIRNAALMASRMGAAGAPERIPKEMLNIACGVVFLTILKVGLGFSGRYGTGIVVSRLPDESWSAPSAVTISGIGWGFQAGGELTDVMLVLTSDAAVETFKSRGQVSVGAELGVSAGPFGRSVGSDFTAGDKGAAHAFSYAHAQGIFMGASLEACVFTQRKDVNQAFYGEDRSASQLLSGDVPRPRGAEPLYKALDNIMYDGLVPFDVTEGRIREYSAVDSSIHPSRRPGNGRFIRGGGVVGSSHLYGSRTVPVEYYNFGGEDNESPSKDGGSVM